MKKVPQEKPAHWIEADDFERVVRLTPLVSIDLLVRAPDGRILVGRRKNEPARGMLFVAGGRIGKNETRAAAFKRITREELGIEKTIDEARFQGVYDHFYPTNALERPGFGTHYVSLGYELPLEPSAARPPQEQHGEYLWLTEAELLARADVHENTKAFFA